MNQEKIGKFIASRRKEKNITQIELASQLGVTNKTVSRWENGHYIPDVSLFNDLCTILDIQVTELLNGEKLESDYEKEEIANTMKDLVDLSTIEIKGKKRKFIIINSAIIAMILVTTLSYLYYEHFVNKVNTVTIEYKGIANKYFEYILDDQGLKCSIDGNVSNPSNDDYLKVDCNDEYFSFLKKDKIVNIEGLLEKKLSSKEIQNNNINIFNGDVYVKETEDGLNIFTIYAREDSIYGTQSYTHVYVNEKDEYVQAIIEDGELKVNSYMKPQLLTYPKKEIEFLIRDLKDKGYTLLEN